MCAAALALPALSLASPPRVPNVSGVTQYVETVPTAAGPASAGTKVVNPSVKSTYPSATSTTGASKPIAGGSAGKGKAASRRASAAPAATPLGAAVSASKGGGFGGGALLGVILVLITLTALGLSVMRRRRNRTGS
jgi:hypothetical protein